MKTKTELKDWIPLISKLIYPFIALIVLFVYRVEINRFYSEKVMNENSDVSVEVAGFALEIKQKAGNTKVDELGFSSLGLKAISDNEFSGSSQEDADNYVTKSTHDELRHLIQSNSEKVSLETLILVSGKNFSSQLLHSYISRLGVKYVVFVDNGKYLGLIEAKLFESQLSLNTVTSFDRLFSEMVGINEESLGESNTVLEILDVMNSKNLSELAITEQGELSYIVEREAIIAKLVASIITEPDTEQLSNTE